MIYEGRRGQYNLKRLWKLKLEVETRQRSLRTLFISLKMDKESLAVYTEGEWYAKLNGLKIAAKEYMNRLVMNFFVIEGNASTAAVFQREAGVDPKVDLVTVGIRTDIMNAISDGDAKRASQLLRDFYPSVSGFHLNKQTLIELIRVGEVNSVLEFAVDHIVPSCLADESVLVEIEEVLCLLAFEQPSKSPLGDLLSQSQRLKTAFQVNAAILAVLNPQTEITVDIVLKALLYAQDKLDMQADYPSIRYVLQKVNRTL